MAEAIVVLGHPGSGKTTQCEQIACEGFEGRNVQHVSAGQRMRAIRHLGAVSQFSSIITAPDAPQQHPDSVVRGAIFEAFSDPSEDELLLFDGYPRYSHAVSDFCAALKNDNHTLLGAVHFEISIETSRERVLGRGPREGDPHEEKVRDSFASFNYSRVHHTTRSSILTLINFASVETINASGDTDDVHDRFKIAIGRLAFGNRQPE